MSSAFFIALRRLRAPLILLIVIFAVSITGLVVIPGEDAEGKPWHMDFFHAFYFISYTASTIGFGEIPYPFTDAQRLWVTLCIFLSVIGWAYTIGKLLSVLQDRGFRQAVLNESFEREVRHLTEPFYLVCGYGETGRLLCQMLDRLRKGFVVLDRETRNVDEVDLQDYRASAPAYAGDVSLPDNLLRAGLTHPRCQGVLAVTHDDATNLSVAIAARLLNPEIPAFCRTTRPEVAANMASFGTRHIINPYETLGKHLALAIRSPGAYQLLEWLTSTPGATLPPPQEPPRGYWLVCGHGNFGKAVIRHIQGDGMELTIIDPKQPNSHLRWVSGVGTQAETLLEAGIERAAGIIAGTENDADNLSIIVTAREINPDLYVVARQNRSANRSLFTAVSADYTVILSDIIAHACLANLTTPLLARFLAHVREQDDAWADALITRMTCELGPEVPDVWQVVIGPDSAPGLCREMHPEGFCLERLRRDPANCEVLMPCLPMLLLRKGHETILPPWDRGLKEGDQILFAGLPETRQRQLPILLDPHAAAYTVRGRKEADGWLWRKLTENRP